MTETEIRYVLDGRTVVAPVDPAMSPEDVRDVARRVHGTIHQRTVSEWRTDAAEQSWIGPTDEDLLRIYSCAEGDSSYDGWLALWRAGAEWQAARFEEEQ